jgi:hypothetical protein
MAVRNLSKPCLHRRGQNCATRRDMRPEHTQVGGCMRVRHTRVVHQFGKHLVNLIEFGGYLVHHLEDLAIVDQEMLIEWNTTHSSLPIGFAIQIIPQHVAAS